MSSPPLRRLSETSTSSKESLINAYEAEEERIINILSRKLEQLREEKIDLENALEAESESHVNRLSREISALRLAQQQTVNGSGSLSPVETRLPLNGNPLEPSTEMMLDAMRRENEALRGRLIETERDYIRISRLNEIYREELIEHRRRLGLPVDSLIGLAPSAMDPYNQPLHRRASSSTSPFMAPQGSHLIHTARVAIPRPSTQVHRSSHTPVFESPSITPPSSSSASLSSPPLFSPPVGPMSNTTSFTTPASSSSMGSAGGVPTTLPRALELTYPSVPPPSLSSSFGDALASNSPVLSPRTQTTAAPVPIPRPIQRRERDLSVSPIDTYGVHNSHRASLSPRTSVHMPRRPSFERNPWAGDSASASPVRTRSRMASVERGARVAETGTLVPKARAGSTSAGTADTTPSPNTTVAEQTISTVPV